MKTLTNVVMEKSQQKKDVFSLPIVLEQPIRKLVVQTEYQSFWLRMFEKILCFITGDGSNDYEMKPEDLPEYHVAPP